MNAIYLFFISALLVVDVSSECDHYIDCFTEFLHEFFNNTATDGKKSEGDNVRQKHFDLKEKNDYFDVIIKDITGIIKNIDVNVKESQVKKEENNKTKIHVKIFEFGNDYTTELTTDENKDSMKEELVTTTVDTINFPEILLDNSNILPFETTTQNLNVIPLHNDKDNEIFTKDDFYDDDNSTNDYPEIDYLELYKDTTNEDIDFIPTDSPIDLRDAIKEKKKDIDNLIEESLNLIQDEFLINLIRNITGTVETCNGDRMVLPRAVFPWIATIYLKNETNGDQFDYVCDGALVSKRVVLTAARCVYNNTRVIKPENFLVILGKTSLQISNADENILKVTEVKPHENFTITDGTASNDLALLVLEDPVSFNNGIATACLSKDSGEDAIEAVTTAWGLSGDLTLVYFDKEKSKACGSNNKVENTFCATYGDDVALCPSYGGLYVTKSPGNRVFLHGLRTGNTEDRGICYSKDVAYTSLVNYHKWIQDNMELNK